MFPQFKDLVTKYKPSVIFSDGEWELTDTQWHSPNYWRGCSMNRLLQNQWWRMIAGAATHAKR